LTSKWDRRFLEMAQLVASWSKDPSTKTGAVIVGPDKRVVSIGFNGFPSNMSDSEALYANRDEKYSRIVHCEINAMIFAGRLPQGSILYTHPFLSCDRCTVQMLQAGIVRFVAPKPTADALTRWGTAFERTKCYIGEAGATWTEVADSERIPEESLRYDWNNYREAKDFLGANGFAKCKTCNGSGEYEGGHGPRGCQACCSRCIAVLTTVGVKFADYGDHLVRFSDGTFDILPKGASQGQS
jgi:dCMP deaminase